MSSKNLGAVDIGSNAVRLLIANIENGSLQAVKTRRVPVRLGGAVFKYGKVSDELRDQLVEALTLFKREIQDFNVEQFRVVATSAVRRAKNKDAICNFVEEKLGFPIETISGLEEARLIGRAIRHAIPDLKKTALIMDIGGGSVEFICLQDGDIIFVESLRLGTVRILAQLEKNPDYLEVAERLLRQMSRRVKKTLREQKIPLEAFVGTGGNFGAVGRVAEDYFDSPSAARVKRSVWKKIHKNLKDMSKAEREETYGLRHDRSDVIVPALFLVRCVMRFMDFDMVQIPGVGLREGIIWGLQEEWLPTDARSLERSCLSLGRRMEFKEQHACQVGRLALEIFDGLSSLHQFGALERELLYGASLLHDVGRAINSVGHHKHSRYIISNADIVGVSPRNRNLMAVIARYHRKALPDVKHLEYAVLTESEKNIVKILSAILRCADSLDRSHESRVNTIDVECTSHNIIITAYAETDLIAESWAFERKAAYLGEVFGDREIELHEIRES